MHSRGAYKPSALPSVSCNKTQILIWQIFFKNTKAALKIKSMGHMSISDVVFSYCVDTRRHVQASWHRSENIGPTAYNCFDGAQRNKRRNSLNSQTAVSDVKKSRTEPQLSKFLEERVCALVSIRCEYLGAPKPFIYIIMLTFKDWLYI